MIDLNCNPSNTLIIEDSKVGYESAISTNAEVLRVVNAKEVTLEKIKDHLDNLVIKSLKQKYKNSKLTVVIPMAGAGSRFEVAGYTFPKPLIEVKGKPMIQLVLETLNIEAKYIFIVRKEHIAKYSLKEFLNQIAPGCEVITTDGLTEGSACTVLLAKEFIDNDNPILMANSDQYIEWDAFEFMKNNINNNFDGSILTFEATHPKWSFVKIDNEGFVTEVAEKKPISNIATVGIYWWLKGSDFVKYAEKMIEKDIRVNNEFYICPVFNEAIAEDKKIGIFNVDEMWGIGTPEDLNYFLSTKK
jgi:NDP-sugar pyrophosphorylase family protein